jgi:transcription elongation factor GreA-like protein
MRTPFNYNESDILTKARLIDPILESFLIKSDFAAVWSRIRKNVKDEKVMIRQFNDWFDGFKTLKLINYMSKEVYAPINMFTAVNEILNKLGMSEHKYGNDPDLEGQKNILQHIRKIT